MREIHVLGAQRQDDLIVRLDRDHRARQGQGDRGAGELAGKVRGDPDIEVIDAGFARDGSGHFEGHG